MDPACAGRRWRQNASRNSVEEFGSPACAGETWRHLPRDAPRCWVDPRVRGEAHALATPSLRPHGSIPACAGRPPLRQALREVHVEGRSPACAGRPKRVQRRVNTPLEVRVPACAGRDRLQSRQLASRGPVDPLACAGRPRPRAPAGGHPRSIPACAGRRIASRERGGQRVDPRVRGETACARLCPCLAGSIPRAAGETLGSRDAITPCFRSIPACAGRLGGGGVVGRFDGSIPACAGDHEAGLDADRGLARGRSPRARGGQPEGPGCATAAVDPRVRGGDTDLA